MFQSAPPIEKNKPLKAWIEAFPRHTLAHCQHIPNLHPYIILFLVIRNFYIEIMDHAACFSVQIPAKCCACLFYPVGEPPLLSPAASHPLLSLSGNFLTQRSAKRQYYKG